MPNEIYNELRIKCSDKIVLEKLFNASMENKLLEEIKPMPDGFVPECQIKPTVYLIDDRISNCDLALMKNSLFLSALSGSSDNQMNRDLYRDRLGICSYYSIGAIPGKQSFKRLSDQKMITPIGEGEFVKNLRNTEGEIWYSWRIKNWGTKWDIFDVSAEVIDLELRVRFKSAWQPPVKALSFLVQLNGVDDVRLGYHSFESEIMGTWSNGQKFEADINMNDYFEGSKIEKMFNDLFA